jgi:hypothetical protein
VLAFASRVARVQVVHLCASQFFVQTTVKRSPADSSERRVLAPFVAPRLLVKLFRQRRRVDVPETGWRSKSRSSWQHTAGMW